ncbi:MAG: hypothetical protein U5L02_20940 [Rheinheimera sp.]|nr:hypothetical protein [Rheinheimera sp.]
MRRLAVQALLQALVDGAPELLQVATGLPVLLPVLLPLQLPAQLCPARGRA